MFQKEREGTGITRNRVGRMRKQPQIVVTQQRTAKPKLTVISRVWQAHGSSTRAVLAMRDFEILLTVNDTYHVYAHTCLNYHDVPLEGEKKEPTAINASPDSYGGTIPLP